MEQTERNRRKRKRRLAIGILGFLILLAAAFFVIVSCYTVENVVVEGNELYEESVIESTVLNDDYSWNSLYVYLKYKFTKINNVPFIDTMEVTLTDRHTLHIKVYEKGMMGYLYIESMDANAYFDKDGFVVEISDRVVEDVPKIEGLSCEEVELLATLPIDADTLSDILSLTQALKREDMVPDSIRYGESGSPILVYDSIRIQIGSLDNLTEKVKHLVSIWPSLEGQAGTLYLDNYSEESPNIVFSKDQ